MSGEARGQQALCFLLVKDATLTPKGVSLVAKPYWLHPLPVVGGGVPITRH